MNVNRYTWRAVPRGILLALPLLFLLPSCGDDNLAPNPAPSLDTAFQGNYDPGAGVLEFAVESPGGGVEPYLKLVATEVGLTVEGEVYARVAIRNTGPESVPGPAGVEVSHFQPTSVYPVGANCPVPGDSFPIPMHPPDPVAPCFFNHRGTYGEDDQLASGETSEPVTWEFAGTQGNSFGFRARLVPEALPLDGVIAGVVFEDVNENGQHDFDEPGIAGVGVGLELPDHVRIDVTGEQGRYVFEVPDAGLYRVILTVPDGARATTPVELQVFIVRQRDGSLSSFLHGDFGLVRKAPAEFFVEGVVFMDDNRNGQRDLGEGGVPDVGIGVSSLECMLPVIGITRTDARGFYEVPNTNVGCPLPWLVQRMPVPGTVGTTPDQVVLEHMPPDGSTRLRVDFGIAPADSTHPVNVTIEGVVFGDSNRNGVRDEGEAGIAGAQIQLMSPCDVFRAVTTNERGFYQFLPEVVRMCPVTGVWQWMPMYPSHTTPNPVEIEMPTVPGNHLFRVDFGIGPIRSD